MSKYGSQVTIAYSEKAMQHDIFQASQVFTVFLLRLPTARLAIASAVVSLAAVIGLFTLPSVGLSSYDPHQVRLPSTMCVSQACVLA